MNDPTKVLLLVYCSGEPVLINLANVAHIHIDDDTLVIFDPGSDIPSRFACTNKELTEIKAAFVGLFKEKG